MPFTRHAFERVGTAILETKTRPGHQVLDRAGDEHLTALGECGHARADVNGDAAELIADDLAFAGVQTGANLESRPSDALGDRAAGPHRASGTVERRQKAVPSPKTWWATLTSPLRA